MRGALGDSRCGRRFQEEGIIAPRFSEDDAGNDLSLEFFAVDAGDSLSLL